MTEKSINTARIIQRRKPAVPPQVKPEQRFPAGRKVYAILRGEEQDAQIVEAEVQGHDKGAVLITYTREDGIPAIEPIFVDDIATNRARLEEVIQLAGLTEKIGEIEEAGDILEKHITQPQILDGAGAEALKETTKLFELKTGDIVAVATDKGIGKDHNEDCIAVAPSDNVVAVFDGMGEYGDGDKAARISAEEILESPDDIDRAVTKTVIRLGTGEISGKIKEKAGTCFVYTRIVEKNGQKFLDISQAGDVRVVIYDRNGFIKFESEDQTIVQYLVNKGLMTADQALYSDKRYGLINAITGVGKDKYDIKKYDKLVPLDEGDRGVIVSDGISDNLTTKELWELIAEKTPQQAIETVSDVTDERMLYKNDIIKTTIEEGLRAMNKNEIDEIDKAIREAADRGEFADTAAIRERFCRAKLGKYSDDFLSEPKSDNRAIAIVDIT